MINKDEINNKKNKIIFILILVFLLLFVIIGYYNYINNNINKIDNNFDNKNITNTGNINNKKDTEVISEKEIKKEDKINKIGNYKKELASKGLLIKGDIHLQNDEYLFALKKFHEANKQTPNNPKIISKIAETYFLMKNYKNAFKYYLKINDNNYLDNDKKTLSFLYSEKLEDYNFNKNSSGSITGSGEIVIKEIKKEIKELTLEKDQEFYYLNSLECIKSFHICKLNYENYFKNSNYSAKNNDLENIRNSINNYNQLKLEELYYKNTLIIGAFLQNKNYPLSIILSKELLKEKPKYKPLLKIIAQSYFELNNLKESYKYLLEYAKIDSKSPDVSYMIGVISQKNKDYIRSNIFLKLAIEQGYKDKESIYRLQLYNYLILGENKKISEVFDKIISSSEIPNFTDLALGTYYNIINRDIKKAGLLANIGIKNYPEKEDFYGFKAWILIEQGDYKQAEKLLEKAAKINPRNALIILNRGRINKKKYEENNNFFNKAKAKLLFEKTIEFDSAEIGELAKKYLKELDEEKSK